MITLQQAIDQECREVHVRNASLRFFKSLTSNDLFTEEASYEYPYQNSGLKTKFVLRATDGTKITIEK